MKARIAAWAILALVLYGVWSWGSEWKSPWSMPSASIPLPITKVMPQLPDGCRSKAECL